MNIIDYFAKMGREESFTFTNDNGEPDIAKARAFAEDMRHQFGSFLGEYVTVEQRVNKVMITIKASTAVPA
jgi:hypothetical protein